MIRRSRLLLLAAFAVATGLVAIPADALTITYTSSFSVPPSSYPYTLVVGRTFVQLRVSLDGATGEEGAGDGLKTPGGAGAAGGHISATLPLGRGIQFGDVLQIWTGLAGNYTSNANPLAGGFAYDSSAFGGGGRGGGGSGIYDETQHRWIIVAAGGGGGGATGIYGSKGTDGSSPSANHAPYCPEEGQNLSLVHGRDGESATGAGAGGGGGGGGCYGGPGGVHGKVGSGGAGGSGGRTWNYAYAQDVSTGTAPRGDGSATIHIDGYSEPPPEIVSPSEFELKVGHPAHVDLVGVGKPPPDVTLKGTFPAGLTAKVPLFSGKAEIRGTPELGSEGTYRIEFHIRNDWGRRDELVKLVVEP